MKVYVCLVLITLVSCILNYSAMSYDSRLVFTERFAKHLIFLSVGWLFFLFFKKKKNLKVYEFSTLLYFLTILLLVLLFFFGKRIGGAVRWFRMGIFSFQPSELSKLSLILFLSFWYHRYLSEYSLFTKYKILKEFFLPLFFTSIFSILVFFQPDLGTSLELLLFFFLIYLLLPFKKYPLIFLIVFFVILLPYIFSHLKPYQQNRILVFINPQIDPLGAGFSTMQAKIAIGSGGLVGKGFLKGSQSQLNFLPERHTDFVFSVWCEEWGFIGANFLFFLYFYLFYLILKEFQNSLTNFKRMICLGALIHFSLHFFINIFMCLGLLPVVGLPLPFLSYGGSHTLINFILLGLVFNKYL